MGNFHFLHDIQLKRGTAAYTDALTSPVLAAILYGESVQLKLMYQAAVGRKTGRLMMSARAHDPHMGGKHNDRLVGKVTIADERVVSEWKGQPFYYGEFHEEGTKKKGRNRRRKYGTEGYHELRRVAVAWRAKGP